MCVRTVRATNLVQFVVWTKDKQRPKWGSTSQGGEASIPAGVPTTGRSGWFVGHLAPGSSMTYTNLTVDGKTPVGLP